MRADWRTRPTLTVEEAAAVLGVSRATAYRAVKLGQVPSIRLGEKLVRVPTEALLELMASPPKDVP